MLFDEVYKMMLNVDKQSLDMSLQDCHVEGCFMFNEIEFVNSNVVEG